LNKKTSLEQDQPEISLNLQASLEKQGVTLRIIANTKSFKKEGAATAQPRLTSSSNQTPPVIHGSSSMPPALQYITSRLFLFSFHVCLVALLPKELRDPPCSFTW
jgi:hypothetical protein